ncbi:MULTISPECIES: beta-ketoacyl synthase [unclassified Pseudofrankia]|uniref:beta-ketoacyl-[acyl-carrier-protein] synthase family protein n=1 Tax=unclassified Pseudofrankia TaxID=2994372 RepID=UPI0008D94915|nr:MULTISPECIES: beta-ketoacyl-[acyl-carrier-protein] synthase family protein [unclassified Pseudofrankia]MDT3442120.1 beta-ketoacyl-[acyl-carrier-protein] synthase family protein [Pseudofrankia sp. BMG5.37]OHV47237.1 beta-ACP synthase [Pseudofrankia sp. BMG5.36]
MTRRRTAITGVGVVAPGGTTRKEFWAMITDGRTATRRLSLFDPTPFRSQVAAECDFDPLVAGLSPREVARNDRFVQFALVAAAEAVADSGLEFSGQDVDGAEPGAGPVVGVSLGSAVGATTRLENEYVAVSDGGRYWEVDPRYGSQFLYHALVPSCLATEVATRFGAHGPAFVVSTGCTSGIDAVGYAHQLIVDGEADIMIAGASDAPLSPISIACFDAIRATSARNDDPEHASRPFDASRDGFVMGEGSAVLVLEEYERAVARGAHIYAEVGGYASRSNAFHMTGLRPDGREMAEAIRLALDEARVDPSAVDYVNAHGSGTKQNDRHETAAFKRSLGAHAYQVPVSSLKSMVGHSLGAIGSIELAACALAIEHDVVPPTANWATRDPECDLDYVPNIARDHRVDVALSVGSGFGGFQSAIVLTAPGRAA